MIYNQPIGSLNELAGLAQVEPGSPDGYLSVAASLDQALALLVDTRGWNHPSEVLDPDRSIGIPYAALIRLARAREAGSARMLDVRQRLEEALAAEMAEDALVDQFVARLLTLPLERAELLLGQAGRKYRNQAPSEEVL